MRSEEELINPWGTFTVVWLIKGIVLIQELNVNVSNFAHNWYVYNSDRLTGQERFSPRIEAIITA